MIKVILVNKNDKIIGQKEKIQAHIDADLHRAFSVLLYNSKGEMLIHKRANSKYHCPNMWTNACCSHPTPGESRNDAAKRRMKEELGYENIKLIKKFTFTYKKEFDNGLTENEIDTVFVGFTENNPPKINPDEIQVWKWISISELLEDIKLNRPKYSFWFQKILAIYYGNKIKRHPSN